MIRTDVGHGRGWLDAPAAASLARVDSALGRPLDVNSAGRTPEEQQEMVDRMNAGGPFALPVGESVHEDGYAVDSDDADNLVELLAEHGWIRTALARGEWWHVEYFPHRDQHINDKTPSKRKRGGDMAAQYYRRAKGGQIARFADGVKIFGSAEDYERHRIVVLELLRKQPELKGSVTAPPALTADARNFVNLSDHDWFIQIAVHGGTY